MTRAIAEPSSPRQGSSQPVLAGVLTSVVGVSSTFAVVLAGLQAVGANHDQAASGLIVLCLVCGLGTWWLSRCYQIPVILAWSTPGAALLASSSGVAGGWPAAVGAFMVVGALIVVTGLWPVLGELIAKIPTPIAQAMLAGVLLPLCQYPVTGVVAQPWLVVPVIVAWLLGLVFAPRFASPIAFLAAVIVMVTWIAREGGVQGSLAPVLTWTTPQLSVQAVLGLALPLWVVTMASQNVPGVAVLSSFGYQAPWRPAMLTTGAGTVLGAPFGAHTVNLAAITAALSAGPEAGADTDRRWLAGQSSGLTYLVLGVGSAALTAAATTAPPEVMLAVAGLALLGTLAGSLSAAMAEESMRLPALVTFVVAASGVTVAGIGAAFWALLAGLAIWLVVRVAAHRTS